MAVLGEEYPITRSYVNFALAWVMYHIVCKFWWEMAGVLSRKDSRTSRWKFQDDEVIFLLYVC